MTLPEIRSTDTHFVMPGMATAHSHAFQRALRGRTQRRAVGAGSFWSWRGLMYRLAETLDPDDIYAIASLAYMELALSGVTAVGEFHYLHHDENGRPYANRTETADACIRAARDVGIRICLIRTAYLRAGFGQELAPAQRRFVDADVETVLEDVDTLRKRYAGNPQMAVAVAAHSIRAVPVVQIRTLADYARQHRLPFHMHISEQRRELVESTAEYGVTPVKLLVDNGILSPNFVGVHATHLDEHEIAALGSAQAAVCLCRTTERDLGDGLPAASTLVQAGMRLCVGVDSHSEGNAFEEVRAVELDERTRLEARHTVADAPQLLEMATCQGYRACGMEDLWVRDTVTLNRTDPALAGADDQTAVDTVLFGAHPRCVDTVAVAGTTIVAHGRHARQDDILARYLETLRKLDL